MENHQLAEFRGNEKYCLFLIGALDDPIYVSEKEKDEIIKILEQGKKFVIVRDSLVMLNSIQSIRPVVFKKFKER